MRLTFKPGHLGTSWLPANPWFVRAGVILGLLAANVAIGVLAAHGDHNTMPLFILVGIGSLLGVLLVFRVGRFEFGILLIPLAAGLLNFASLPTGTQSRIVISLVVAFGLVAVWILQWIVIQKRVELIPSPVNAPVLIFMGISIVSYIWSSLLRDPVVIVPPSFAAVQLGALAVNVSLPFLLLVVSNKFHELRWLWWLNWIVVALGALAAVSFLFNLPTAAMISNGARGVFPAWAGALVCAQALFNSKLARWQRAGLWVLLAALVYYYFIKIPGWFSGWFPLGLALGVVLFRRSKKLFLVAFVAGAVFVAAHPDVVTQNIIGQAQSKGDFERLSLWRNNLDLVAQHPLLGVGPAGYAPYYMTYHPQDARSTHNNYFDVLAQTGILGFAVFLWLQATLLAIGRDNCRRLANRHDFAEAFATATLAGGAAAFAAMMLGDWVLPFAYNQTITGFDNASLTWILLGAAISLHHIITSGKVQPAEL
jgi:O-antigen ligase